MAPPDFAGPAISAVVIDAVPSSATRDDLAVPIVGCGVQRVMLFGAGPGSLGTALLLLPSPEAAETAAELLDGYPVAGSLLEARVCTKPWAWLQRAAAAAVGGGQMSFDGPASPSWPADASPPPVPPAPNALSPLPLLMPPSAAAGWQAQSGQTHHTLYHPEFALPPEQHGWNPAASTEAPPPAEQHPTAAPASGGVANANSQASVSSSILTDVEDSSSFNKATNRGIATMEAELWQLQLQLQQQAGSTQPAATDEQQQQQFGASWGAAASDGSGGGAGGGGGFGVLSGDFEYTAAAAGDSSDGKQGWQEVGRAGGGGGGGAGAPTGAAPAVLSVPRQPRYFGSGGSGGGSSVGSPPATVGDRPPPLDSSRSRLVVGNVQQQVSQQRIKDYFKQFGLLEDVIKFPEARYVFVHYLRPEAAAAAMRATHGKVASRWLCTLTGGQAGRQAARQTDILHQRVAALNPSVAVSVQLRKPATTTVNGASGVSIGTSGKQAELSEPSKTLWVGNVVGTASLDTLGRVFRKYGKVFDLELQRGQGAGRTDQWGFVNFYHLEHAQAAYRDLRWSVIPELTGSWQLKVQYR